MNLQDNLEADLAAAMKLRDEFRVNVLRLIKNALKNQSIEVRHELSMAETIIVLQKEAKKRADAATTYEAAGRPELADEEKREGKLIATYLPAQLSDAQLSDIVDEVIEAIGATTAADIGKVMARAIPKIAGRADGARISLLVAQKLQS